MDPDSALGIVLLTDIRGKRTLNILYIWLLQYRCGKGCELPEGSYDVSYPSVGKLREALVWG